jgi:hypothetical protein
MSESKQQPAHTATDQELSRRFTKLRTADAASAPPFPLQGKALARPHVFARWNTAAARIAAVLAVVALGLMLLRTNTPEDPAVLYAGIMANNPLQTDSLLTVSDSVLPALNGVPELYEIDEEAVRETYTN